MKCLNCGKELPDNAKYCSGCGEEQGFSEELLERAQPLLCLSRFGQAKPLPARPSRASCKAIVVD